MSAIDIKTGRKRLKLTQEKLAKLIGVSKNTISNYEIGRIIPESKIPILCRVLEIDYPNKTFFANDPIPPNEINEPKEAYILRCKNCENLEKEVATT